jgi:alpha-L-fucosidase
MNKLLIFLVVLAGATCPLSAQRYKPNWASLNTRGIPAWFNKAKFGIFIHWGVYSVPSYAPVIPNSGASYAEWYWNNLRNKNRKVAHDAVNAFQEKNYGNNFHYGDFEKQFHAELFDPGQWARIFKQSGARYVVLTSKHHEGYCLWDSPWADKSWGHPWNAVTGTPKRDLLGDLTGAVRKEGLRMGYYYSLYEWYNPLWLADKQLYIQNVMMPELKNLVTRYKPSVIFADGEWDLPDTAWHSLKFLAWLFNDSPVTQEVVVNDRWGSNTRGRNTGSTYTTSEYGSGKDPGITWEESQGIGYSYGYNRMEALNDYKSGYELILRLIDVVSRGGNLLLDVGPTADGRIPVVMQQRLADIGKWLKTNGAAVYDTHPWERIRQWSEGVRPETSKASYMSGYDIGKLTSPGGGNAHIEMFFTQKGKNLYCIIPNYKSRVNIREFRPAGGMEISLLGYNQKINWVQKGNGCEIDLSSLQPQTVKTPLVIELRNSL